MHITPSSAWRSALLRVVQVDDSGAEIAGPVTIDAGTYADAHAGSIATSVIRGLIAGIHPFISVGGGVLPIQRVSLAPSAAPDCCAAASFASVGQEPQITLPRWLAVEAVNHLCTLREDAEVKVHIAAQRREEAVAEVAEAQDALALANERRNELQTVRDRLMAHLQAGA
ncbi:hypothetical protein [Roseomonas populi]|uniref:Uncharacterized protein n=1 Tax=Roseomonas populi TaxID=3121582 RepID=A0ABT1X333_9PROT|nr:hypothetical protein [Roseomonas pecuniae]MCR0981813.1 hypothetical protein [Roseomonas pecuniae]